MYGDFKRMKKNPLFANELNAMGFDSLLKAVEELEKAISFLILD